MTTLQTFEIPEAVKGVPADIKLGRDMIAAWQRDGIFQVATDDAQGRKTENALAASPAFSACLCKPRRTASANLTYSGYVGSGEVIMWVKCVP